MEFEGGGSFEGEKKEEDKRMFYSWSSDERTFLLNSFLKRWERVKKAWNKVFVLCFEGGKLL